MKKIVSLALVCVLLLGCVFALASCGNISESYAEKVNPLFLSFRVIVTATIIFTLRSAEGGAPYLYIVNENSTPFSVLRALQLPEWSSTMLLAMARPSPLLFSLRDSSAR